jgi:hypothetical protein
VDNKEFVFHGEGWASDLAVRRSAHTVRSGYHRRIPKTSRPPCTANGPRSREGFAFARKHSNSFTPYRESDISTSEKPPCICAPLSRGGWSLIGTDLPPHAGTGRIRNRRRESSGDDLPVCCEANRSFASTTYGSRGDGRLSQSKFR